MKYSVNPNLNAVMNSIEKLLLSKGKDKQESIQIIKRYIKSFPKEPDYAIKDMANKAAADAGFEYTGMNTCCG